MDVNEKVLIDDIVGWINGYMDGAGLQTCVVGVSGGVDSACIERLSERTGKRVVAVAMPMYLGRDSNSESLRLAMELCVSRPGVEFYVREIGPIVEVYKRQGVGGSLTNDPKMATLLEGNLRSRIRANVLYDFAGATRGLVMGTGNRDEDEIGYFTKGGDGLVDICALSLLHKSLVRRLARLMGVPNGILEAKPTAGLWNGQTDEDELGMNYDEVEWAIRFDDNPESVVVATLDGLNDREREVLIKVRMMRKVNAHKLKYPPVYAPTWLKK